MKKKVTILIAVVASLGVIAIPAPASAANWKDKGVALSSGTNPILKLQGNLSVTGSAGGIDCPEIFYEVELTGGTSDGHVVAFGTPTPSACDVTGLLGTACGTHSLTATSLTTPLPTLTDGGTALLMTGLKLDATLGTCSSLALTGSPTLTPDNQNEISNTTISGTLTSAVGNFTASGTVSLSGSQVKTYGL